MDISPLKSIGFKLQTDETERLIAILNTLNVNYSKHTSRETFVFLIDAIEKLLIQLTLDKQNDNEELIDELRVLTENNEELTSLNSTLTKSNKGLTNELRILTENNQELITRNSVLTENNKELLQVNLELTENNQGLKGDLRIQSENNQELSTLNSGLTEKVEELTKGTEILSERNQALISEQEILSQDLEELSNQEPKMKVIEKAVPIQLGQYQLLIDLNYFQLALLAKVANHFSVESLFNKQSQLNPAAFVRVEGKPKDRLSQTLINTFMGVQFNYHRGNTYLPENVLTGDYIRKKGKEYQEQIAE